MKIAGYEHLYGSVNIVKNIYDKTLKVLASYYLGWFFLYFGIVIDIEKSTPTEIITRKGSSKYVDILFELKNKTLFHLEFQFNATTDKLLKKFYGYNQAKSVETGKIVNTMIINFQKSEKCVLDCWIGQSIFFKPINIFLGDIDFEKRLNNIEERVINSIQKDGPPKYKLSIFEEIDLILVTLVPQTTNKEKSLLRVCKLFKLGIIEKKENENNIRTLLNCQIDHFIDKKSREEFRSMLMSDKSAAEIFREIEYEEAFREGKAEGFAKAENEITEKLVLKLLSDFDLKTISEMLEIDLSKVKEIAEKQ